MAETDRSETERADRLELAAWRRRLLPFAILVILLVSAFFIWVSHGEFAAMKASIERSSGGNEIASVIDDYRVAAGDNGALAQKVQLLTVERAQRANLSRASASLLLSLWTREMGFVTGMMLAIVGATFILVRLDDAGSKLEAGQGTLKGSLMTSSPGIVLAVLGTVLMAMAMSVRYSESGKDTTPVPAAPARSTEPITATLSDGNASADTQSDLGDAPANVAAGAAQASLK